MEELAAQGNGVYSMLPASKETLATLAEETSKDPYLAEVAKNIQKGWRAGQSPVYSSYRDELSVCNGIILKGSRMVIPASLRKNMLERIHEGHLGAEKQKRLARDVIFWPNMNKDIDEMVKGCGACQKFRPAQPKETYKSDEDIKEIGPWDKVGVDLFAWENDAYLVVVDYYSNCLLYTSPSPRD